MQGKKEYDEQTAARLAALKAKIQGYFDRPWLIYQKPFRATDRVYYVGTSYVASYLIDTGDGLVLIDTGFQEHLYQVIHNLHLMGYNPADIRFVFLSHGHVDHCGGTRALQELSGAKVYIGEGDLFFFTERRDLICDPERVPEFQIDGTYDYAKPWRIGEIVFEFVHTPGHTPGCTTILIHVRRQGREIVCAMHGGLGLNGLTLEELRANRLPESLHQAFYDQLVFCQKLQVDVPIPSHNHDYDILGLAAQDDGSGSVFQNPDGWKKMLGRKIVQYQEIL